MKETKVRVMCSYGGQIVPRPHDKSLTYSGGDTRIVSLQRLTSTLSSLILHLSSSLITNPSPFLLKYQLPGHDLDSLVSLSNQEDFDNMLDEYDHLSPARLRIFVFPDFQPTPPPDTILLQTSSSFGSTASSLSIPNSPLLSLESTISESQADNNQDITDMTNPNPINPYPNTTYPSPFEIPMLNIVQLSGRSTSRQIDTQPRQHELLCVPADSQYISHYPVGPTSVPSYYPTYQPNQPFLMYLMPLSQTQTYIVPIHGNFGTSNQLQMLSNVSMAPPMAPNLVLSGRNHPQFAISSQIYHPSCSISPAPMARGRFGKDFEDDPAYGQIYKTLPSAELLSEGLTQLHMDHIN